MELNPSSLAAFHPLSRYSGGGPGWGPLFILPHSGQNPNDLADEAFAARRVQPILKKSHFVSRTASPGAAAGNPARPRLNSLTPPPSPPPLHSAQAPPASFSP